MTRHLIIDGYNLLGVRGEMAGVAGGGGEAARERLLRELAAYRQRKGHPITVVFDGWRQGPDSERREHRAGLQVVFSRQGERADQVIQRLVDDFGPDCAVVSSDREVADFARARGALTIGAGEFDGKLRPLRASTGLRSGFGKEEPAEDLPVRRPDKKGNPRKLPKAQRRRNRDLRGF